MRRAAHTYPGGTFLEDLQQGCTRSRACGGDWDRHERRPARWCQRFTVAEWSLLPSLILTIRTPLLAFGQWKPDFRTRLRGTKIALGLVAGLSILAAAASYRQQNVDRTAIVITPEAVVRRGPFAESESAFTARDGVELEVVDARPDWWLVADPTGRSGWIAARQVAIDPVATVSSSPY